VGRQRTMSAEQIDGKLGHDTAAAAGSLQSVHLAPHHASTPLRRARHQRRSFSQQGMHHGCCMAACWSAMVHACTAEHAYKQPCGNCPRLRIMDLYNYQ